MSLASNPVRAAAPGPPARARPVQRFQRSWTIPAPRPQSAPAVPGAVSSKAPCSCGGGCPRCQARSSGLGALRLSQGSDAHEREADQAAAQVLAGQKVAVGGGHPTRDLMRSAGPGAASSSEPAALRAGLQGLARPLDPGIRYQLEGSLQQDLSAVRLHPGALAAASAAAVQARAYTVGHDIVFGAGQYAPGTRAGQHLLAHELVHVLQQRSGTAPPGTVQRAPTVSVMDADFIGPPSASQRRAAVSCPIDCCLWPLGTLHTMPLFFHESRGAQVPEGSARATGIGAALHFIASPTQPPVGDACHCDAFQMIQVITATHPADPRGTNSFVDNDPDGAQPFYGAPAGIGRSGHGEHAIPGGYTDAGERITTTESVYDRPYRTPADLGTTSLRWEAETCVACVKNAEPDRILGCTTYGFSQHYDTGRAAFDPVQQIAPACGGPASTNFLRTLRTDRTTTAYDFQPAPRLGECFERGDFPMPSGDTRYA